MSHDDEQVPGGIGAWDPQGYLPYSQGGSQKNSPAGYPSFAEQAALPKLPPTGYPTFADQVSADAVAQVAPRPQQREASLFESMLQKQPEHILQSATETPGRYDERALSLLRAVYANTVKFEKLTPAEQELINEATLEFFSTPKPKQELQQQQSVLPNTVASNAGPLSKPIDGPVLDAFWWT